jgi:hypothetical protein
VPARRARRLRGNAWVLLAGALLFGALFLSMRQDLQLQLLRLELVELRSEREDLEQQLRAGQRALAARTDLGCIVPRSATLGLRAPAQSQVLALVREPAPPAATSSLPMAVLDFISGAGAVQAAQPAAPEAAAVRRGEGGVE